MFESNWQMYETKKKKLKSPEGTRDNVRIELIYFHHIRSYTSLIVYSSIIISSENLSFVFISFFCSRFIHVRKKILPKIIELWWWSKKKKKFNSLIFKYWTMNEFRIIYGNNNNNGQKKNICFGKQNLNKIIIDLAPELLLTNQSEIFQS